MSAVIDGGMLMGVDASGMTQRPSSPRPSVPSSISIERICSMKSGLPCAAATIRAPAPWGSLALPRAFAATSELSSSVSGRSDRVVAFALRRPQAGRSSSSS